MTFAQQLDGVGGLGQLGGYRVVRRRSCSSSGQVDHSLLGRLRYPQVGLGLGELIVALDARSQANQAAPGSALSAAAFL